MGRRLLYSRDLCGRVRELGAAGKNRSEIIRDIGFDRKSVYRWMKKFPEFRAAMADAAVARIRKNEAAHV